MDQKHPEARHLTSTPQHQRCSPPPWVYRTACFAPHISARVFACVCLTDASLVCFVVASVLIYLLTRWSACSLCLSLWLPSCPTACVLPPASLSISSLLRLPDRLVIFLPACLTCRFVWQTRPLLLCLPSCSSVPSLLLWKATSHEWTVTEDCNGCVCLLVSCHENMLTLSHAYTCAIPYCTSLNESMIAQHIKAACKCFTCLYADPVSLCSVKI